MRISDWSSDVWSSDLSLIVKPLTSAALCERFVATATAKFARNVPDFVRLQSLVAERGGSFRNDHAAIRSADPQVCALFVRAARVLGLRREQLGRASCRERVCQYVLIWVVAVLLKK